MVGSLLKVSWIEGLKFSVLICWWGLIVAAFSLLPWAALRLHWAQFKPDENVVRDVIVSTTEVCRRKDSAFDKFSCLEIDTGWLFFQGALNIGVPLVWVVYLRASKMVGLALLGLQSMVYFILVTIFLLSENEKIVALYVPLLSVAMTVPVMALSLKFGFKLVRLASEYFLLMCVGSTLIALYDWIQSRVDTLTFLLLVMPVFKVISLILCRSIVKPMFIDEHVAGLNVAVRRDAAWFFLLFVQFIQALLPRMVVINLTDWGQYTLFMLVNSLLELAIRYSPFWQDHLVLKCTGRNTYFDRRKSIVLPVSGESVKGDEMELHQFQSAQKQWYALVVVGDMVSEYVAVFMNFGLVLIFHDAILMLPLPVFEVQSDPFTQPMPVETWFYQTIIQIVGEILIDSLCFSLEHLKLQFPIREAWTFRSWTWRFTMLSMAAFTSTVYVISFFKYRGEHGSKWCETTDVCSCGLRPESLYGQYCTLLNQTNLNGN